MKLGLMLGYSGRRLDLPVDLVQEAESLGYDSVWMAESWGNDACTPLAYLAAVTSRIKLGTAIMQVPARTPANAAMTALTLNELSNGRFIMGLGMSGPQVVEGWHGKPYRLPLSQLREYIEILRLIFAREKPLEYSGKCYDIPFQGERSTGQGKALKSMMHGGENIPIYCGSLTPKSQQMCGELADGCLLTNLVPERADVALDNLRLGFAKKGDGKDLKDFDLACTVAVILDDDLEQARRPLRMQLARYVGGFGTRKTNFYKDFLSRSGWPDECEKIQDLFLAGKQKQAIEAVPNSMIDALYLIGPEGRIKERFQAWKDSPVGTLMVGSQDPRVIRLLAGAM
jgi:F420-dependent oxidoreductase-like protein